MTLRADNEGQWPARFGIKTRGDGEIALSKPLVEYLKNIGWKSGDRLSVFVSKAFNRADERGNYRVYVNWDKAPETKKGKEANPKEQNTQEK